MQILDNVQVLEWMRVLEWMHWMQILGHWCWIGPPKNKENQEGLKVAWPTKSGLKGSKAVKSGQKLIGSNQQHI